MVYAQEKKVDTDAICLINVMSNNWTNLGPTSVDLIFYAPNDANLGFWKIWLILSLYVCNLHYKTETLGLAGGAFSIRLSFFTIWRLGLGAWTQRNQGKKQKYKTKTSQGLNNSYPSHYVTSFAVC